MSLKETLLEKCELKNKEITVNGLTMTITELDGAARSELVKIDGAEKRCLFTWNAAVEKSERMNEDEFSQAFKFNFQLVNDVVLEIGELSGMFADLDETEKN